MREVLRQAVLCSKAGGRSALGPEFWETVSAISRMAGAGAKVHVQGVNMLAAHPAMASLQMHAAPAGVEAPEWLTSNDMLGESGATVVLVPTWIRNVAQQQRTLHMAGQVSAV